MPKVFGKCPDEPGKGATEFVGNYGSDTELKGHNIYDATTTINNSTNASNIFKSTVVENPLNDLVLTKTALSPLSFDPQSSNTVAVNSILYSKKNDVRPHVTVSIAGQNLVGLLDSGATCSILGSDVGDTLRDLGLEMRPVNFAISTADGTAHTPQGYIEAPIEYAGRMRTVPLLILPSITKRLILGMDFWKEFQIEPRIATKEDQETCRDARVVEEKVQQTVAEIGDVCVMEEEEEKIIALEESHELSAPQRRELESVIETFRFSSEKDLGFTSLIEHSIDTGTEKPIRQRSFLVSPYLQEEINREVDRMLALGVIEPASSPWSNPIVAVRKANGKLRYCLDARKLNAITVPEAYPMQDLNRILARLKATRFLSSIDLSDAFWQVGLRKEDRPKTAFAVGGRGFFMFVRMPFGLRNSPATLAKLVEMVIGCDLEPWVFKYMDDIIVATDTFERHVWVLAELA